MSSISLSVSVSVPQQLPLLSHPSHSHSKSDIPLAIQPDSAAKSVSILVSKHRNLSKQVSSSNASPASVRATTSISSASLACASTCVCGSCRPCDRTDNFNDSEIPGSTAMNHPAARKPSTSSRSLSSPIQKTVRPRAPSSSSSSQRWSMLPSPTTSASNLSVTITPSLQTRRSSSSATASPSITTYSVFASPKLSTIQSPTSIVKSISRKRTSSITNNLGASLPSSLEANLFQMGSFGSQSYCAHELQLEQEFCKDFWCCGLVLEDLHELNLHIQLCHPELSSVNADGLSTGMIAGLESLFLNELIPGVSVSPIESSKSPDGKRDRKLSPKLSFFTPPTSLSPAMSPKSEILEQALLPEAILFSDEPEPFAFSEEDQFFPTASKIYNAERRNSGDTLAHDDDSKGDVDDLLAFDDESDVDGSESQSNLFEDTAVGLDILSQMERIGIAQEELGIDRSLALMLLQCEIEGASSSHGPLLTSAMGAIESTSPPVAPAVRFGPHQHENFTSSSISLADIYRESDDPIAVTTLVDFAAQSATITANSSASTSAAPSSTFEHQATFNYESASEMSLSESEESDADFEIDVDTWDSSPYLESLAILAESTGEHGAARSRNLRPQRQRNEPFNTYDTPMTTPDMGPTLFRTSTSKPPTRRQSAPIPKVRLTKHYTPGNQDERQRMSKCTKKMRVGSLPANRASASATSHLALPPTAALITASSPVLTPPHHNPGTGFTRRKTAAGVRQQPVNLQQSAMSESFSVEAVDASISPDLSPKQSALTKSLAQAQINVEQGESVDDSLAAIPSTVLGRRSSRLEERTDVDILLVTTASDDALNDYVMIEDTNSVSSVVAEEDAYGKQARKRKGASGNRRTKKEGGSLIPKSIAAGVLVGDDAAQMTKVSKKALAQAARQEARLAKAAAAAAAAASAGIVEGGMPLSSRKVVKESTVKLDPAFLSKFKSRAVAETAHATKEALAGGSTLAELVVERLPKVKAGEEKRLKLGSLSILDPETAEKRFFCPVCKKEYKNANGLKYHLNHSHTKPNELPSGYYFGKKKKEAEDLSKPFVCAIINCGKRYKNLNGLKYHAEHGHVPGAVMEPVETAEAEGDASNNESEESEDEESTDEQQLKVKTA
ncbi:Transcriptional regulator of ribosomal biogenesis proteins [Chytriomyces hyalinus]|nr:Transcriptional regulator of ribosomal biogenesis proteins [Chytriomyces hyalinus]